MRWIGRDRCGSLVCWCVEEAEIGSGAGVDVAAGVLLYFLFI